MLRSGGELNAPRASAEEIHDRATGRSQFRRLWQPVGRVNRKKGRDATVDIRDSRNVEEPSMFIVQVAAVSCAATHVPGSKMANHSFRYTGFRSAAKVEVLLRRTFISVVEATAGEFEN